MMDMTGEAPKLSTGGLIAGLLVITGLSIIMAFSGVGRGVILTLVIGALPFTMVVGMLSIALAKALCRNGRREAFNLAAQSAD